ncbi:MAG: phytanoyl-CoA dioxygenase family protein [Burkholderiales bacterium]|nr:phytanoyl-CoA dioxygenase family protein [Burkholderiales bacterium]
MSEVSAPVWRSRQAISNHVLTPAQVEAFGRDGYHFPLPAFSPAEIQRYRDTLEGFERRVGGSLTGQLRNKPHLLFTWADEMVRHPAILDAVEDVLGPDLLVWSSSFFTKEARDPGYVSWHQDSTYWGLSEPDVVTAWIAFSDSVVENGCMRVIPGTHRFDQLPHKDTFAQNNMLTRGQEVMVDVDPQQAIDIELQPGQFSLHHVRVVHGSEPNPSGRRRIGFAVRYVPTYVRQTAGPRDSAMLVRGTDRYHHFDPEPRPKVDFGDHEQATHRRITEEAVRILYRGTDKVT